MKKRKGTNKICVNQSSKCLNLISIEKYFFFFDNIIILTPNLKFEGSKKKKIFAKIDKFQDSLLLSFLVLYRSKILNSI